MHIFEDTCLSLVHNVSAPQSDNNDNNEAVIQTTNSRFLFLYHPEKSGICSTLSVNTAFTFIHFNSEFAMLFWINWPLEKKKGK